MIANTLRLIVAQVYTCFIHIIKSFRLTKITYTFLAFTSVSVVFSHRLSAQIESVEFDPLGIIARIYKATSDGNTIVYISYTGSTSDLVAISQEEGVPRLLYSSNGTGKSIKNFALSPDGTKVAYTINAGSNRSSENELWILPLSGGSPLQLLSLSDEPIDDLQFSQDGNTLLYLGSEVVQLPQGLTFIRGLFSIPASGGSPLRLSHTLTLGASLRTYSPSPDGSRVVYVTGESNTSTWEIHSVPLVGGNPVKLGPDANGTVDAYNSFTYSSDGARVVYAAAKSGVTDLFSIPTEGGNAVQINPPIPQGQSSGVFTFGISPDNNTVIYTANQTAENIRELFAAPITGGDPIQLNPALSSGDEIFDFKISANGSRVIYDVGKSYYGGRDIFSVPATGGPSLMLNTPSTSFTVSEFALGENSDIVAYSIGSQVFKVPVDGSELAVELTQGAVAGTTLRELHMSPDGSNVAFASSVVNGRNQQISFISTTTGSINTSETFSHPIPSEFDVFQFIYPVANLQFTNNDTFFFSVNNGYTMVSNIILAFTSGLSSATLDSPTQITVTFSTDVATNGGNPSDFTVTDGIGNTFPVSAQADGTAGDADIVLTVADVSTAVGDLTLTYTNNNDEVSSLISGDPVGTDDTGVIIDTDMIAPTLVSAIKDSETQITLTFSELIQTSGTNPTDFTVTDGLGAGFTVSIQADGTAEDTDLILTVADLSTAVGDLTVTYTNNNNEINDFGENNLATDVTGVTIDTDNVTPTLVSAVKGSDTQITITLSERVQTNGTNPTDFTVTDGIGTDFAVSAQADGTANDTEVVLTVADLSATVGDLRVTYTNNNNELSDFGGNDLATDATGVGIDTDMTAPTLVSAVKDNDTQITITLSEQVQTNGTNPTGFTVTDGLGATYAVSAQADGTAQDTDIILTVADLSIAVGDLTVTYTNNNNEISDFGSNDLATDATGLMIDTDVMAPTMVSAVKNSDTQITITFNEPVQTNGTNPTDFTIADDNSTPFTVSAQTDGTAEDTDIVLTVADLSTAVTQLTITYANNNNEVTDFGGNDMVSDATGIVILLDVIPPDVTLTTMANDPNSGAFDITATFTEDVMNVATSDFNVTNGTATTITGTGAVYTVTITPAADGTVTVNLPANTVQDLANNDNTASNTITLENDETAPTAAITSLASDPTSGAFDITITFSEAVTGFDVSDITVGNGVAGNFAGSGTVYTATITPAADGTVTVDVTTNAALDAATNGNTAATQFSIENDETDPAITITSTVSDPTSGAFDATFTFSEDVTGFDLTDLTVGNGVASNFAGSGATYTATITPAADGTVTIDVAAAVAQDAGGNDNTAATQFSIENDETEPTVTITTLASDPINVAFDITITFSEDVTGFDINSLTGTNGMVSNLTGSGAVYTVTVTPSADGALTVDLGAASAQDAAGNDNTAAAQFSILSDLTAPAAPVVVSISDDNGNDLTDAQTNDNTLLFSGTAEANSTVEVFIDGSSIGTTVTDGLGDWTYDHTATTLTDASYNVTATATDAAGNVSAQSSALSVSIDTISPVKPEITSLSDDNGPDNSDNVTNDRSLIFYGTAEAFTTIELKIFGFTFGTGTTDVNGDWIVDVSGGNITTGNLAFSIISTDIAGNTSTSDNFNTVIEVIAPEINSLTRAGTNPTAASSIDFTATFSEAVYGLSTSNFELVFTGTQTANIASVSAGSGTSITITVDNISGEGTFGLNLHDGTGITDLAGNALGNTKTGEVYNTNFTPTDISLSTSSILENNTIGDVIATISTTDADAGDSHTYSLVAGAGDTDNASFTISGDELKAAEAFDLETKASYDLRIQTDDGRGGVYAETLTITIDNVPEADLRITGNNDIPATPLGITTSFDITVHNDGDAMLTIGSILYPTAFGGPVSGINVAPASSQVITLTFTPTVAQLYTGDITMISNGGTGILSVSADGAIITSVDDGLLKAEAIQLYPNPATTIVTIDLSKYNGRALDIQLYDMSGTKTFGVSQYKEAILKLDVSHYHNGLYLVQLTDGKSTVQKKIMIRK